MRWWHGAFLGCAAVLVALAATPWLLHRPRGHGAHLVDDGVRADLASTTPPVDGRLVVSVTAVDRMPLWIDEVTVSTSWRGFARETLAVPPLRDGVPAEAPGHPTLDLSVPLERTGPAVVWVHVTALGTRTGVPADGLARRRVELEFRIDVRPAVRTTAAYAAAVAIAVLGWLAALGLALAIRSRRVEPPLGWTWRVTAGVLYLAAGRGFVAVVTVGLGAPAAIIAGAAALWLAPLALAWWLSRRLMPTRFRVVQAAPAPVRAGAYRVGPAVPRVPTEALIPAWQAAGFHVEDTATGLRVATLGTGVVEVPHSVWRHVGGGTAFDAWTRDEALLADVLAALEPVLGELRWHRAR